MKHSKLTLVIDGNWLLMSRLSVLKDKISNENDLVKDLKLLMCKSIKTLMKQIPGIDNIIFCADGGSWRCDIDIPKFLDTDNITYKGNRGLDDSLNWDAIFGGYGDFIELLSRAGITTCREFGIEGDDWCWYLSNRLNSEGTNVIIWSMDKDLTQLVKTNRDNGIFTVCWNRLYMTMEDVSMDEMNFLFNYEFSTNESLLNGIKKKAKDIHRINPKDIVIDKIIRGDDGDNVLPIILKQSATSSKTFRVASKDIDMSLDIDNYNDIESYITELLNKKSYKNKVSKSIDDIITHFLYNKRLVYLNKSSYPEEILELFEQVELGEPCINIVPVDEKLAAEKLINNGIDILEDI